MSSLINRTEFLKRRKNYICGSDISAIAGVNPYKSAVDIYLDKINPEIVDFEVSEAAHFGNLLEDVVAQEYSARTGFDISLEPELLVNPKYPFIAANIDRWANNKQHVLEVKTASLMQKDKWGVEGSDSIPEHYLCQVALYAAVCEVPFVEIALLLGGQQLKIYRYNRDLVLEDNLIKIAKKFWENNVQKQIPPQAINLSDTAKLYPESKDQSIDANYEIEDSLVKLIDLKFQLTQIEEDIKTQQVIIQNYMGDNGILLNNQGNVLATWKSTKGRASFDSKRLQKDQPEIYNAYITEGKGYRTFLVKNKNNTE